jgi:hypothetical protein
MEFGAQDNQVGNARDEESAIEILIGRIVDGEATTVDRTRFENLAMIDPLLWKRLAIRQQEMAAIVAGVHNHTNFAEQFDVPGSAPGVRLLSPRIPRVWILAISGWAALIALVVYWGMHASTAGSRPTGRGIPAANVPAASMSFDDHLREYMHAPFVHGELPPSLLAAEKQPDGRTMIRILRRIEEIAYLEADEPLPVDTNKNLTKPPAELRGNGPSHDGLPN